MRKINDKPIQAVLAITFLALAAFVLMAVIVPGVTDRILQDRDGLLAEEPEPIVGAVMPVASEEEKLDQNTGQANITESERAAETLKPGSEPTFTNAETIPAEPKETKDDPLKPDESLIFEGTVSPPDPTETSKDDPSGENKNGEEEEIYTFYLTDDRIKNLFNQYAPTVASIQVFLPGTTSTNDKIAVFSGLIISEDGQLISFASNFSFALSYGNKLYERAEVRVIVPGRPKSFACSLEKIHKDTDLALFKIADVSNLPYASLNAEAELHVGEPVIAIGQSDVMMLSGGLFPGLITGLYHPAVLENDVELSMIQTSAFISQQASGGPLINLEGEIIGLNNSHLSRSYSDIMGYAIPAPIISSALEMMEQATVSGDKAWLGIATLMDQSNEEIIELMDWPSGLYISKVDERSPSYTAGVREGDILTSINGISMKSHAELTDYVQKQPIGTLIHLRVFRAVEKKFYNMQIYLGRMP